MQRRDDGASGDRPPGAARLAILILLAGAAAAAPAPASAAQAPERAALSALRADDERALAVGWRLAVAAAPLCDGGRPGLGWVLHGLDQYRPGLRDAAQQVFGLAPGRIGVLALAPDGPADRAGVRRDDLLIAFAGRPVASGASPTRADYSGVADALAAVEAATQAGPIAVRVLRAGREVDLTLHPRPHCPWPVQVEPSNAISAGADGRRVSISSGLVRKAGRDDELAFILGHEMAHNLRRPEETGDRARSRAREVEADRIGLILAARAGYDTAGTADFVRRLGRETGWRPPWFGGHPPPERRAQALERTQAWIEARRRAGAPLNP